MQSLSKLCCLLIAIFLIIGICRPVFGADRLKIKAGRLYYKEGTHLVIATENVQLEYKDVQINAQGLNLDTKLNMAWGTGNIRIERKDENFNCSYFFMDLDENIIKVDEINIAIEPYDDIKSDLFVKVKKIEDHPDMKHGTCGRITTCDLEHPHWYAYAESFEYYPDKRMVAHNMTLNFPLLWLPFKLWTPLYFFELGERRFVWNFPTIGKKETDGWGWFMQNTFDYDLIDGKESSILVDWFENKGIGLGVNHQYKVDNHSGNIYYYKLQEEKKHEKIALNHQIKLNENLTADLHYGDIDAERINSVGQNKKQTKKIDIEYDDSGDKYKLKVDDTHDRKQQYHKTNIDFEHSFNKKKLVKLSYNQNDNDVRKQKDITTKLENNAFIDIGPGFDFKNVFDYKQSSRLNSDKTPDDTLKSFTTLSSEFNDIKMNVKMDNLFDLDGERVTSDLVSNTNRFFYRLPEVTLDYNKQDFGWFKLKEKVTLGRYREMQYDRSMKKEIDSNEYVDFNWLPNTYIFENEISKKFTKLPFKSDFDISMGYDQYIFQNKDKDIFSDSDAMYTIDFKASHKMDLFEFMKLNSKYKSVYAPEENRTPFFKFDTKTRERNELEEKLTFYYDSVNKYKWEHKTVYDWIDKRWRDWYTTILLKPDKTTSLQIKCGKKLNPRTDSEKKNRWHALNADLNFVPSSNFTFKYHISIDTNKWADNEEKTYLNDSNFTLGFHTGDDPDYRWEFEFMFDYDIYNQSGQFYSNRYEMQTYKILKRDHCRTFSVSYNKRLDEFRFKCTILALPDHPFGIKKTKEMYKVEGIFDDDTKERF